MEDRVSLTEATAEQGHNIAQKQKAFHEKIDSLGTQGARGTTVLADLVKEVIEAACDGLIKPQDARDIYERYRAAFQKAGGTPASIRTNAAKLKKLIEPAGLGDGMKLADDAIRMRSEIPNAKSVLDALSDLARLRLKEKRPLTDDEIKGVLTKAAPKVRLKAEPKHVVPKAEFKGWPFVAIQVNELIYIRDEDSVRYAYAIRAQLDNYLRDDFTAADADRSAESPDDTLSVVESTEAHEAAHVPPAVNVQTEDSIQGENDDEKLHGLS